MPPLPRFRKLPEEKRRAILNAAADEFAEHGFEGASLNRIIASAGISKGAMYYYFADKEDLYGAVLDDVMEGFESLMVEVPVPTTAAEYWNAAALGLRISEELFEDTRSIALMRDLYTRGPGDATWLRLIERSSGWVKHLLARGQELGAVRDDLPLDLLTEAVAGMVTAIDRWFERAMTTMEMGALLALTPKILELLQDLLEPRPD